MKNKKALAILILISVSLIALPLFAQEKATPEDVYEKVMEAAAYLSEKGDAALSEFNATDGQWVFKDTYIFVYDCDKGICAAIPSTINIVGKKIEDIKDINGLPVGNILCETSKKPNGGWMEYMWPVLGTDEIKKKISFIYRAPGATYTVGAGIYAPEGITVEELNKKLEEK